MASVSIARRISVCPPVAPAARAKASPRCRRGRTRSAAGARPRPPAPRRAAAARCRARAAAVPGAPRCPGSRGACCPGPAARAGTSPPIPAASSSSQVSRGSPIKPVCSQPAEHPARHERHVRIVGRPGRHGRSRSRHPPAARPPPRTARSPCPQRTALARTPPPNIGPPRRRSGEEHLVVVVPDPGLEAVLGCGHDGLPGARGRPLYGPARPRASQWMPTTSTAHRCRGQRARPLLRTMSAN